MPLSDVVIVDTTLREGEQFVHADFSSAAKIEIARALAEAGVRVDPHALEVMDTRCMAWLAAPDDAHEGGIAAVSSRLV